MTGRIALVVRGLFELSNSIGFDCVGEYRLLVASGGHRPDIRIFAETVNPLHYPDIPVEPVARLRPWLEASRDATVIYHWCDGWPDLDALLPTLPCRLIVRWHNNTPPWFYARHSLPAVASTMRGFDSLLRIARSPRACFWVNSVYTARQLALLGIAPRRIHVVYPLSPFLFGAQPPDDAADGHDPALRLLFVGRAVPHKGHKHLVAIAALAQQASGRRVRLAMVGRPDGSTAGYVAETMALAANLGVAATFPGEVPFAELSRVYRASDVFVCFSEHEGFGLPVFEAMRHGLPVVGLRSTAVGEFLHAHPLAVASVDYPAAAALVLAAADADLRRAVVAWQRGHVLPHYTAEIVVAQIAAGLAGNAAWPTFGGLRDPALDLRVADAAARLRPRPEAADLPGLADIPCDTVDRLVTRYDLESFRILLSEARRELDWNDFVHVALTVPIELRRRRLRWPLRLIRRVTLSLQVGLLYALNRMAGKSRAGFGRIEQELADLRGAVMAICTVLAQRAGAEAVTVSDPALTGAGGSDGDRREGGSTRRRA